VHCDKKKKKRDCSLTRKNTCILFQKKCQTPLHKSCISLQWQIWLQALHLWRSPIEAPVYQRIYLKVKVITKQPDTQTVVKNKKAYYKVECMVANCTNSIKLILWEVLAGKSYLLQNVTVRYFGDKICIHWRNHSCTKSRGNYRSQYKYTRSSREPPHRTVCRDRHVCL